MKKIMKWYNHLSNRIRTSVKCSLAIVGFIATVMTIMGCSLNGCIQDSWTRLFFIVIIIVVVAIGVYYALGKMYKDSITFDIKSMPIEILVGDIFAAKGFKVIGCDTHFDTRVDDIVISKKSLHGQLVLGHGNIDEIKEAVENKAHDLGVSANDEGLYEFPLGTVIRYDSSKDGQTYLMVALTEIREENGQYKAYTSMAKFEETLHRMWDEIDGIYASNDITLPLLGTGISRFEGGRKNKEALLRCMLCTLNSCGVDYKANVRVVIHGDVENIPLFEYRDMFRSIQ